MSLSADWTDLRCMRGIRMSDGYVQVVPGDSGRIGMLSHAGDQTLTAVRIPEGVAVIEAKAFSQCEHLRTVYLPASLTNIDMKSFENCPLEEIYFSGTRQQWQAIEISPQGSASITAARKHFAGGSQGQENVIPAADQSEELYCRLRSLLGVGDGRFHIFAPDLCLDGVLTKPGDCTLLVFPQGSTMLIDTGYFANLPRVEEFLRRSGLRGLDYLVFSHADGDHVSNAQAIADFLYEVPAGTIRHFWWTGQAFGTVVPAFLKTLQERGVPMELDVRAGKRFVIDGVQVDILGPTDEEMQQDCSQGEIRNSQSMMMKFTYGKASYLTCGDLYAAQEAAVIRRCGELLKADICKTNHHGCFTSNTVPWLDAVRAKVVFSCSNDNGSTALAEEMARRQTAYYTTGCQGSILISADTEGTYHVMTQYDCGLRCSQRVNE